MWIQSAQKRSCSCLRRSRGRRQVRVRRLGCRRSWAIKLGKEDGTESVVGIANEEDKVMIPSFQWFGLADRVLDVIDIVGIVVSGHRPPCLRLHGGCCYSHQGRVSN